MEKCIYSALFLLVLLFTNVAIAQDDKQAQTNQAEKTCQYRSKILQSNEYYTLAVPESRSRPVVVRVVGRRYDPGQVEEQFYMAGEEPPANTVPAPGAICDLFHDGRIGFYEVSARNLDCSTFGDTKNSPCNFETDQIYIVSLGSKFEFMGLKIDRNRILQLLRDY